MRLFSRFIDSNDRELRRLQPFVDAANDLEAELEAMSDSEIRERFEALRAEVAEAAEAEPAPEADLHHPDLERRGPAAPQCPGPPTAGHPPPDDASHPRHDARRGWRPPAR